MTQKLTVWYTDGEESEYEVDDGVTVGALRAALGQPGQKTVETTSTQKGPTKRSSAVTTTTSVVERTRSTDWVVVEVGKSTVFLKLADVRTVELTPAPKRGKKA